MPSLATASPRPLAPGWKSINHPIMACIRRGGFHSHPIFARLHFRRIRSLPD